MTQRSLGRRSLFRAAAIVPLALSANACGDLDSMLYKVADVYDEEVTVAVDGLISMLEPMMVVVLGVIIGSIVISLFVPLLSLLDGLSK